MKTALPTDDLELLKAFENIPNVVQLSEPVKEICKLIVSGILTHETIEETLDKYKIDNIIVLKEELLDLLIAYIHRILDDQIVSDNERRNMEILKRYFKIREGDFYNYRYSELEKILQRQFEMIYADNTVSEEESIHNVALQELFDLSYDQLDKFKQKEVFRALEQGADFSDLDTASLPKSKDRKKTDE